MIIAQGQSGRVDIGKKTDPIGGSKVLVHNDLYLLVAVVDQSEGRNGSRFQPEETFQAFRRGKTESVLAELSVQLFEIRPFGALQNDQIMPVPLFVPDEQILAVRTLDAFPVFFRLLDRIDRRMVVDLEGNVQAPQNFIDFVFRFFRHVFLQELNRTISFMITCNLPFSLEYIKKNQNPSEYEQSALFSNRNWTQILIDSLLFS
jgi:hypothetical protein